MKNKMRLYLITVIGVLVASAALFVLLYTTIDPGARVKVKTEVLKVLLQLAAIGVIGGFITWILSERSKEKDRILDERSKEEERQAARQQKRAERQNAMNEFRLSAIARIVTATNVVRKAPLLIASHRSKKTYGEQVRAILDAKLDLSLVRHEQESSKVFTRPDGINAEIHRMEAYLERIVDEWRDRYKSLPDPPHDAWNAIKDLPALADLRTGDEKSLFDKDYLMGHKEVLRLMRDDIFSPTDENGLRPA